MPWFHGFAPVENLLEGKKPGYFLIRCSSSQVGTFTVSFVAQSGKITHRRIKNNGKEYLLVLNGVPHSSDNIPSFKFKLETTNLMTIVCRREWENFTPTGAGYAEWLQESC
mmetsp:Transcript_1322/g.1694  ORF Transcript_1322/g.1694 Transcript_1322/m.1694 type:complete len:111 (+) Transcript_1322:667-999(+)